MSAGVLLLVGGVVVQAIKPAAGVIAGRRWRKAQRELQALPMPAPDQALDNLVARAAAALDRHP